MNPRFYQHRWLAAGLITSMMLVAIESPVWIQVFCALILIARLLNDLQVLPQVPRWVANVVAGLLLLGVTFQYKSVFNQEAATVLLLGIAAIKILDYLNETDLKFLFLLGLLILTLKPLFSYEIYWVAPGLFSLMCLWMGLLHLFNFKRPKYMLKVFVYSVPLTLVLFVVFPRIILPWAKVKAERHGTVGFQENMNPGDVESLVENPHVAFRVTFNNHDQIQSRNLYWRGAVFLESKGLEWRPGESKVRDLPDPRAIGNLNYKIVLEPDEQSYVFSLDKPILIFSQEEKIIGLPDHVFKTQGSHDRVFSYEGRSYLAPENNLEPGESNPALLQLPDLDQSTKELVKKIKQTARPEEQIKELDKFFSQSSFRYTLHPGAYRDNQLSEFIFKRRRGFCEHYAGAYATLARALGIPSRVILGYQGANYNSIGDFWEVSTRDAHAWVEVLVNSRWQRKDPTKFVAPLRIELGAQTFFDLPESERNRSAAALLQALGLSTGTLLFSYATYFVNNLNYQWTTFFLNYNNQQAKLWLWANAGQILIMLLLIFSITLFVPVLKRRFIWPVRRRSLSREIIYSIFGFLEDRRQPSETPLGVLQKISQRSSLCADYLHKLAEAYDKESYQGLVIESQQRQELVRGWRKFRAEIRRICEQFPELERKS